MQPELKTLILRFRDLVTPPDRTISNHAEIVNKQGDVWWGWWNKAGEHVPPKEIASLAKKAKSGEGLKLLLFDSGHLRLYTTHCKEIRWDNTGERLPSPDKIHTPSYYHGDEPQARQWHVLVRREVDTPTEIQYSLSNASADTPAPQLAFMQGQRDWIERVLQNGKQDVGLGDYQVRSWRSWRHHMALLMMTMLFTLEERLLHQQTRPLLSGTDIRALLNHFR